MRNHEPPAEHIDHKAEALRLLEWVGDFCSPSDPRTEALIAQAQVHSNLAIAEGQERVAEELKAVHQAIDGIAWGMGANAAAAQEVRS